MHYDLIILVIAHSVGVYKGFIEEYWKRFINFVERRGDNVKIYLVFGQQPKEQISIHPGNLLITRTPENLIPGVLEKTVRAFEHINRFHTYKHVLRTNLSSFFRLDEMLAVQARLSDKSEYAGVVGTKCDLAAALQGTDLAPSENFSFASGAAIWFSSDIVSYIVANKSSLRYDIIDDVALGRLLSHVAPTRNLSRLDTADSRFESLTNFDAALRLIGDNYHIRLRQDDRARDVLVAKALTAYFYGRPL